MTQLRVGVFVLALVATACGGSVDEYVKPVVPEEPTTTEADAVTTTLATPEPNAAAGAESTTTEATETGGGGAVAELPGAGATLSQTALGNGHWEFFPPKAWELTGGEGTDKQTFSTASGTSTVETIAPTLTEGAALIDELTAAITAEYPEVHVYDSGIYMHDIGYEVVWVRFDIVIDGVWHSAQRFWVVSEKSTFQVTVVADDPESFEDELFAVQGMVNGIDCPEE